MFKDSVSMSEAVRDSEKQRKSEWWKMTFGAKQENGPGLICATVSYRFMSLCSWNMGENINPHNSWAIGPMGSKKASLSDSSICSLVSRLCVNNRSNPAGQSNFFVYPNKVFLIAESVENFHFCACYT